MWNVRLRKYEILWNMRLRILEKAPNKRHKKHLFRSFVEQEAGPLIRRNVLDFQKKPHKKKPFGARPNSGWRGMGPEPKKMPMKK